MRPIKRLLNGLAAVTLGLAIVATPEPAQAAREMDDTEIAVAVETKMLVDRSVIAPFVTVKAKDGIVTLTGEVSNVLAKDRAEYLAGTVRDVRAVVNDLTVRPTDQRDGTIRDRIELAWAENPATEAYEVDASVADGIVTITGQVESWQEKRLAEQVAKSIPGVMETINLVSVSYAEVRSDRDIQADVEARIANDAFLHEGMLDVTTSRGTVTLTGHVRSVDEKRRAFRKAWVAGVQEVDTTGVEIAPWSGAETTRDPAMVVKPDDALADAVRDALAYDPRITDPNVNVSAKQGVVTLTGTVSDLQAKRAAEDDAQNTTGVWRVLNFLKVQPLAPEPDAVVAARAVRALSRNAMVDDLDIAVTVIDRTAHLSGEVGTVFEKETAADVVSGVRGVVHVENDIDVKPVWRLKTDWELRDDVMSHLFWDTRLDADEIVVMVEDGEVTLTGTVDTLWDRIHAENDAYDAGAVVVNNRLETRTGPAFYRAD